MILLFKGKKTLYEWVVHLQNKEIVLSKLLCCPVVVPCKNKDCTVSRLSQFVKQNIVHLHFDFGLNMWYRKV